MSASFDLTQFNQRREASRIFQEQKNNKQAVSAFNKKSKMCKNAANCKYGKSCTFAHDPSELRAAKCVYGSSCQNKSTCLYDHSQPVVETPRPATKTPKPLIINFDDDKELIQIDQPIDVGDPEEDKKMMEVINQPIPMVSAPIPLPPPVMNIELKLQAQELAIKQLQESIVRQQQQIAFLMSINNQRQIPTTVSPAELLWLQQFRL